MTFRLRTIPTLNRAGDVEHRLSVPGRQGFLRGLFDTQIIGVTAVMMHVVDEWDVSCLTDWEQVSGSVGLVVILNRQTASDP